jgi:hypothetical protein
MAGAKMTDKTKLKPRRLMLFMSGDLSRALDAYKDRKEKELGMRVPYNQIIRQALEKHLGS